MTTRRKRARTQRTLLNCDQLAELIGGPDAAGVRISTHYAGFAGDLDAMREAWERHRNSILEWWSTGEFSTTGACAAFCDRVPPWLWVAGSPETRPWASLELDT